ncbi:MAG: HEAT repeat domain-containing protein [Bacteriovoracaceae bacterium]|nr:HEAT repeat domain-containing protein [Bacteriovoracaceae bacterium]
MSLIRLIIAGLILVGCFNVYAKVKERKLPIMRPFKLESQNRLNDMYLKNITRKQDLAKLKEKTISMSGKAVPVLVAAMKNSKYPDRNRWMATFLLGKVAGKQSISFIAKFLLHPNWIMRMASLKTLLVLKAKKVGPGFAHSLQDKSMLVRVQALENIRKLKLGEFGPHVWAMLYDKKNYYKSKKIYKRMNIIKKVIRTIGELRLPKAKKALMKMVKDRKYNDIFDDMDYSLTLLTGKKSPDGERGIKRIFWNRIALGDTVIR